MSKSLLRSDAFLAGVVTLCGILGVAYGVLTQPQPFAMLPGMDGALTAGVLGFGLALLHGMRYRDVLRMLIPVVGIQIGGCLVHGESVVAITGLELAVVGVTGVLMALALARAERPSRRGRPDDHGTNADRKRRAATAVAAAALASPSSRR